LIGAVWDWVSERLRYDWRALFAIAQAVSVARIVVNQLALRSLDPLAGVGIAVLQELVLLVGGAVIERTGPLGSISNAFRRARLAGPGPSSARRCRWLSWSTRRQS
jgi:hypothetical protein